MKAQFVKNKSFFPNREMKSVAIILIEEKEFEISYWAEIIEQYGKEIAKSCILFHGLYDNGFQSDAHDLIKDQASGTVSYDENKQPINDTRNVYQKLIDDYPIQKIVSADYDPFE